MDGAQHEGGTKAPVDAGERDGARDAAVDGSSPVAHLTLCDGSDDIALMVRPRYRGRWPEHVLYENGGRTFLLDGECNLFLQTEAWQPITKQALSAQELGELRSALQLDQWPQLAPSYCRTLGSDQSGWEIWINETRIVPEPCVPESDVAPYTLASQYAEAHVQDGEAVTGSVRYVLVEDPTDVPDRDLTNAEPWPLGDVESAASELAWNQPIEFGEHVSEVGVAEGEEARTLRDLRTRYLNGNLGDTGSQFVPIQEADGTVYRLYMRDSLPFEDADGQIVTP